MHCSVLKFQMEKAVNFKKQAVSPCVHMDTSELWAILGGQGGGGVVAEVCGEEGGWKERSCFPYEGGLGWSGDPALVMGME